MHRLRTWWIIKILFRRTIELSVTEIPYEMVLKGNKIGVGREEFVRWAAWKSYRRQRWFMFWRRSHNDKYPKVVERAALYSYIIDACVEKNEHGIPTDKGLIYSYAVADIEYIRATPLGYKFYAEFWYKAIFKNTIVALLIGAILTTLVTWFITWRLEGLFNPPKDQVYQIQIVPYASSSMR